MWWYQVKKYSSFLWHSKNQHGVHSPFVFDLLTKGVYRQAPMEVKLQLKAARKYFLKQYAKIRVQDFGAGSRVFKDDERGVNRIAKYAGMPYRQQLLMYKLVAHLKPNNLLELGTSVGLGTAAMRLGNLDAKLITVERCPETLKEAIQFFDNFEWQSIQTENSLFTDYLKTCSQAFDFIYLDGGHTKDFTLSTFEQLLPLTHNDSVIVFDDIYWSKAMGEAWLAIKEHPAVTVSIDSFHWGIIFFRKQQQKQHFVLRM
ncbi:MAG: class I SAM-dependent methyltransferase [Gilvibacter sp.]